MRSEHAFHVPCSRAFKGKLHAVRFIIEDARVVYLGADCPGGAAADAAKRLGVTTWCSHTAGRMRDELRGDEGLHDKVWRSLLRPVIFKAKKDRETRKKLAASREIPVEPNDDDDYDDDDYDDDDYDDDDRSYIVQGWGRYACSLAPFIALGVECVDGFLELFVVGEYEGGRSDETVVAYKARGCQWAPNDDDRFYLLAGDVGRAPGKGVCAVCGVPYKQWFQHAEGKVHEKNAIAALFELLVGLNRVPGLQKAVSRVDNPWALGPAATFQQRVDAMEARGVKPYV